MAKQHLPENYLLLALGIGIGIGALLIKKLSVHDDGFPQSGLLGSKEHSCLKLKKRWLEKYFDAGGRRIELRYEEEPNQRMILWFFGYDQNNRQVVDEKLKREKDYCLQHENIGYGTFYTDTSKKSLHDLMVKGRKRDELKDWYFMPEEFDPGKPEYVTYQIGNDPASLLRFRLNPCPPCT